MSNQEIAQVLDFIAGVLSLQPNNFYRSRAYEGGGAIDIGLIAHDIGLVKQAVKKMKSVKYNYLGLNWIKPAQRLGGSEIEKARR